MAGKDKVIRSIFLVLLMLGVTASSWQYFSILQTEQLMMTARLDYLRDLEKRLPKQQEADSTWPQGMNEERLLNKINGMAERHGVELLQLKLVQAAEQYKVLDLQLEGEYFALLGWCKELERHGMGLNRVQLQVLPNGQLALKAQLQIFFWDV